MPKKATIHIQKMEPGPPETMAAETPAMLPVPMVAARAVHRDWNWLMDWSSADLEDLCQDGHQDAGADQKDQHGDAPYKAVDGAVYVCNGFNERLHNSFLLIYRRCKAQKSDSAKKMHEREYMHLCL